MSDRDPIMDAIFGAEMATRFYRSTDAPLRRDVARRLEEIAREVGREHGTQSAKDGPPAGLDDQAHAGCWPAVVPEF